MEEKQEVQPAAGKLPPAGREEETIQRRLLNILYTDDLILFRCMCSLDRARNHRMTQGLLCCNRKYMLRFSSEQKPRREEYLGGHKRKLWPNLEGRSNPAHFYTNGHY